MKTAIKTFCDIIIYVIVFLVIQLFTGLLCQRIFPEDNASQIIATQAISAVIIAAVFIISRWAKIGLRTPIQNKTALFAWITVFTLCTIIPSSWITEMAGVEIPPEYAQLFDMIMSTPLGYATVGIIVPVMEEIVFRGAILHRLLCWLGNDRRWNAIAASALLFALAHGNMAQGAHAFLFGVFLGWLFYRTGSIIPGVVFHLVNNASAVILSIVTDTPNDAKLIEMFGGNSTLMYGVLIASAVISIPTFYKIIRNLQKA